MRLLQKDINLVHHPNGGGLKAVTAEVDVSVYLGPNVIVKDKAKILGKEIKITGTVEIEPNIEILGEDISIFGFKEGLFITKNFKKSNICVYQKGKLSEP